MKNPFHQKVERVEDPSSWATVRVADHCSPTQPCLSRGRWTCQSAGTLLPLFPSLSDSPGCCVETPQTSCLETKLSSSVWPVYWSQSPWTLLWVCSSSSLFRRKKKLQVRYKPNHALLPSDDLFKSRKSSRGRVPLSQFRLWLEGKSEGEKETSVRVSVWCDFSLLSQFTIQPGITPWPTWQAVRQKSWFFFLFLF